jgi:hypothetical protein
VDTLIKSFFESKEQLKEFLEEAEPGHVLPKAVQEPAAPTATFDETLL